MNIRYLYLVAWFLFIAGFLLFGTETAIARKIYISPSGNDNNPGSVNKPLRTLAGAVIKIEPGDTCMIYGGIYRETLKPLSSGLTDHPIVFMSVPGETVTISALEKLTNGQMVGKILEFPVEWDLTNQNMIFCDGIPLTLARWPDKINQDPMDPEAAVIVAEGSSPTQIKCNAYPDNWKESTLEGATVWVNAECKWSSWTSHITRYDPESKVVFVKGFGDNYWINAWHNPSRPHYVYGDGAFYIAGAKILLDAPGEWHIDKANKTLSLILPSGKSLETCIIEMKKRLWTVDLSECSNVQIINIDMIGAPVNLNNATGCTITDCNIRHFYSSFGVNETMGIARNSGIIMGGRENQIINCEIYGSDGNGILLYGERNKVLNCDIHDVNYIGSRQCALIYIKGKEHFISHNNIHNTGRECINLEGGGHVIQYNHIYNPGRISEDLGALYCAGMDCDNTLIHHNIIHNDNQKFIGIYFDNFINNIIAHHNVVWGMEDGIRSNRPGHYEVIYNNTVIPDINNKWGPWDGPSDQFGNVVVNNVYRDTLMVKSEVYISGNQKARFAIEGPFNIPVFEGSNDLKDFPDYIGALEPGSSPFKAGYDFINTPDFEYDNELPFIRNHVRNGCFDFNLTYGNLTNNNEPEANGLEYWEKIYSQKVSIEFFEGFNFPPGGPDQRNSIYGYSLLLGKNDKAGVQQKITTLEAGRKYVLGSYVKAEKDVNVEFSITRNSESIASVNSENIMQDSKSNWKFIKLEFHLPDNSDEIYLKIVKTSNGEAYIDDVGIIPIP